MCLCYIVKADKYRQVLHCNLLFVAFYFSAPLFSPIFFLDRRFKHHTLALFSGSRHNWHTARLVHLAYLLDLTLEHTWHTWLAPPTAAFSPTPFHPSHSFFTSQIATTEELSPRHSKSSRVKMHITVNVNNPDVEAPELQLINLDVPPDMTLADLRSSIEAEGIPAPSQNIYHNGQLITDNSKTLEQLNISDGDMLALHVRDMRGNTGVAPVHREPQRRPAPALAQDPELIRLQVLGDARLRGELERANPHLAAALENPQRFAEIFRQSADQQEAARLARQDRRHDSPAGRHGEPSECYGIQPRM
ncbi:hypothetical protein GGS26DRAFT_463208 [Hypomontagnella submonticulosa]|nr:hypothetical protein GGS26DRAFT_463208 [Hypomontagnella submonticulosa]